MTRYNWVRVTVDQVVSKSPGYIGSVIIVSDGSGNASATIYDGESTGDPVILTVKTVNNTMSTVNFQPALKTERGIYVDIGSNVNELLVQHSWQHE